MTDRLKDQLIVAQGIEIMQLESRITIYNKNIENAERGQKESNEILESISKLLKFKGNYHYLIDVIRNRVAL